MDKGETKSMNCEPLESPYRGWDARIAEEFGVSKNAVISYRLRRVPNSIMGYVYTSREVRERCKKDLRRIRELEAEGFMYAAETVKFENGHALRKDNKK